MSFLYGAVTGLIYKFTINDKQDGKMAESRLKYGAHNVWPRRLCEQETDTEEAWAHHHIINNE
jgi:hypothetical protein